MIRYRDTIARLKLKKQQKNKMTPIYNLAIIRKISSVKQLKALYSTALLSLDYGIMKTKLLYLYISFSLCSLYGMESRRDVDSLDDQMRTLFMELYSPSKQEENDIRSHLHNHPYTHQTERLVKLSLASREHLKKAIHVKHFAYTDGTRMIAAYLTARDGFVYRLCAGIADNGTINHRSTRGLEQYLPND